MPYHKFKCSECIPEREKHAVIKGAGEDDKKQGRYASIKITDKEIAKLYRENNNLIPKAVSIGIWDHDRKTLPYSVIDNYNVVHLAPVEAGAYGPKATLYATCNGVEKTCLNELKGASEVTSLVNSDYKNINIMSEQETVNTKNNPTALSNSGINNQQAPVANNSTSSGSQGTVEQNAKPTTQQPTTTGSPVARAARDRPSSMSRRNPRWSGRWTGRARQLHPTVLYRAPPGRSHRFRWTSRR